MDWHYSREYYKTLTAGQKLQPRLQSNVEEVVPGKSWTR